MSAPAAAAGGQPAEPAAGAAQPAEPEAPAAAEPDRQGDGQGEPAVDAQSGELQGAAAQPAEQKGDEPKTEAADSDEPADGLYDIEAIAGERYRPCQELLVHWWTYKSTERTWENTVVWYPLNDAQQPIIDRWLKDTARYRPGTPVRVLRAQLPPAEELGGRSAVSKMKRELCIVEKPACSIDLAQGTERGIVTGIMELSKTCPDPATPFHEPPVELNTAAVWVLIAIKKGQSVLARASDIEPLDEVPAAAQGAVPDRVELNPNTAEFARRWRLKEVQIPDHRGNADGYNDALETAWAKERLLTGQCEWDEKQKTMKEAKEKKAAAAAAAPGRRPAAAAAASPKERPAAAAADEPARKRAAAAAAAESPPPKRKRAAAAAAAAAGAVFTPQEAKAAKLIPGADGYIPPCFEWLKPGVKLQFKESGAPPPPERVWPELPPIPPVPDPGACVPLSPDAIQFYKWQPRLPVSWEMRKEPRWDAPTTGKVLKMGERILVDPNKRHTSEEGDRWVYATRDRGWMCLNEKGCTMRRQFQGILTVPRTGCADPFCGDVDDVIWPNGCRSDGSRSDIPEAELPYRCRCGGCD
eukprot:TRINITY_DN2060_c0_g1_i10.p1 TRINITY_DN2060_c0_g1~~TRINITY_DN2060_c0_g1_i10.p1  ORF type:complete len:584 (+),score=144.67 TRINITY_DN2060_c0_g1_i10:96-1847(+)